MSFSNGSGSNGSNGSSCNNGYGRLPYLYYPYHYLYPPPPPPQGYGHHYYCYYPQSQPPRNDSSNHTNSTTDRDMYQYEIDPLCSPCDTRKQAHEVMNRHYGGYLSSGESCLLAEGSYKVKCGDTHWKYHCRNGGCNFRCQIRQSVDTKKFCLYTMSSNRQHNHALDERPQEPSQQHGLHPTCAAVVDKYISSSNKCILRIKSSELFDVVVESIQTDAKYSYLVKTTEYYETTKAQVRRFLDNKKISYIKSNLSGMGSVANNDSLIRLLENWEIDIPADYAPRNDYKSADEIASALGLNETHDMLCVNLSSGDVFDCYKELVVERNPSKLKEFEEKVEGAFFLYSAQGLFQLMTLANRRSGTRQINVDGTGGFFKDGSCVIIIGANSVKYRIDANDVTSSLRPFGYLRAGGERFHVYNMSLYSLRELCWRLFGIELEIDWGTSDHADCFVNSHIFYKKYPFLCDSAFRGKAVDATVGVGVDADCSVPDDAVPVVTQLTQDSIADDEVEDDGLPSMDELVCLVDTLSAECLEQSLHDVDNVDPSAPLPQPKSLFGRVNDSVLQCLFHVLQFFANKKGYVGKFNDKSLCTNKKSRHSKKEWEVESPAYKHVMAVASSKTKQQRDLSWTLLLRQWREGWKEKEAADHIQSFYGVWPWINWNLGCTGEPGVYAIGNPNETHNKKIKGPTVDVAKNSSLATFLVSTGPKLLKEDAKHRFDACEIKIPSNCSRRCVAVTGFMRWGVDTVELEDEDSNFVGWIANCGGNIGVKISDMKLQKVEAALAGDESHFVKEYPNLNDGDRLLKVAKTSNSVCKLKLNPDGIVVGNCTNCIKKLGYDCPGASYLRDMKGQLKTPLWKKRQTPKNSKGVLAKSVNKGNTTGCYESGVTNKTSKRECKTMSNDFVDYLRTLKRDQLLLLNDCLKVVPSKSVGSLIGANDMTDAGILAKFVSFAADTVKYRLDQYGSSKVACKRSISEISK